MAIGARCWKWEQSLDEDRRARSANRRKKKMEKREDDDGMGIEEVDALIRFPSCSGIKRLSVSLFSFLALNRA